MDRNSVVGLVLIFGILAVFTYINSPSAEEIEAQQQKQERLDSIKQAKRDSVDLAQKTITVESPTDSLSNDSNVVAVAPVVALTPKDTLAAFIDSMKVETVADSTSRDSLLAILNYIKTQETQAETSILTDKYGIFAPASKEAYEKEGKERQLYTLENDKIRLTLSNLGGRIVSAELKEYESYKDYKKGGKKVPLRMFDEQESSFGLRFYHTDEVRINTNRLFFEPNVTDTAIVVKKGEKELIFRLNTGEEGRYIEYVYTLGKGKYDLDFHINLANMGENMRSKSMELDWRMKGLSTEKSIDTERSICGVFFKYMNEDRDYLSETSEDKLQLEDRTQWVCFKQNFFSAFIISDKGFSKSGSSISIRPLTSAKYTKEYKATLNVGVKNANKASIPLTFYFGPNHYNSLAKYGKGMEGVVNLGWGIFGWVNKYIVIPIFNWLDGTALGYGVIILILTLFIKLLLFPLTYKNYKSSAKMRVLKPEIDEINEQYEGKNKTEKQQAIMGLYRKTGVNPMAGCLPMLVQMPILYAMFRFFPSAIELRQKSFLWADDLSGYDSVASLPFEIPFYGDHVSLFTLLMCVSTIFYTRMSSSQMTASGPGMPNMKFMMYLFPVMMLFFFNSFASGLSYYYFLANLITIVQMLVIKKFIIDEDKIRLQLLDNKKKPKKKSRFAARIEEMQKKQQQQQAELKNRRGGKNKKK
jgi:YidC/Oxa1 family membrane protein insertase